MEDGVWLTRQEAWRVLAVLNDAMGEPPEPALYEVWRAIAAQLAPEMFPASEPLAPSGCRCE